MSKHCLLLKQTIIMTEVPCEAEAESKVKAIEDILGEKENDSQNCWSYPFYKNVSEQNWITCSKIKF